MIADVMDKDDMLPAEVFTSPAILISGTVDDDMYTAFRNQLVQAPPSGLVVVELSTLGGDPEIARMMGEDVQFHTQVSPERRFIFLGKAAVYSAGATFMSFFETRDRYLTENTRLMIHERKLDKRLHLTGPLSACLPQARALLNEIEHSMEIQREGFEALVRGSRVALDDLLSRAPSNWYLEAREAQALGLVKGVI